MGFDQLHKDPVGFAQKDPACFNSILSVLRP